MKKTKVIALLSAFVMTYPLSGSFHGTKAVAVSVSNPIIQENFVSSVNQEKVNDFVTRLYDLCLGRKPDSQGLKNWSSKIINNEATAADVSLGFIKSDEFKKKNLSTHDYIDVLYRVYLNRKGSEAEISNWMKTASNGVSKQYLIRGFVHSDEFTKMCGEYGINRGSITITENRDKNYKVTSFVTRLYQKCLGRSGDTSGLNSWTGSLLTSKKTAADVVRGFMYSDEMKNKMLSPDEYVKVLYNVCLDRNPSQAEVNSWTSQMADGKDDLEIIRGFVHSSEFTNLCSQYGITRGNIVLPPPPQPVVTDTITVILNKRTGCVHSAECGGVKRMSSSNRVDGVVLEVSKILNGEYYRKYWACTTCMAEYASLMPEY